MPRLSDPPVCATRPPRPGAHLVEVGQRRTTKPGLISAVILRPSSPNVWTPGSWPIPACRQPSAVPTANGFSQSHSPPGPGAQSCCSLQPCNRRHCLAEQCHLHQCRALLIQAYRDGRIGRQCVCTLAFLAEKQGLAQSGHPSRLWKFRNCRAIGCSLATRG